MKTYKIKKGVKGINIGGEEFEDRVKLSTKQAAAFADKLELTPEDRKELEDSRQIHGVRKGKVVSAPVKPAKAEQTADTPPLGGGDKDPAAPGDKGADGKTDSSGDKASSGPPKTASGPPKA